MSEPIYMLVWGGDWTEAGHQLSQEEKDDLWAKVSAVDERAGAKWVLSCDSRWADESVAGWAVVVYPDIESYQQKVKGLEELNWWRYFSAKTILGTKTVGFDTEYSGP
jgi:hypothetical protein